MLHASTAAGGSAILASVVVALVVLYATDRFPDATALFLLALALTGALLVCLVLWPLVSAAMARRDAARRLDSLARQLERYARLQAQTFDRLLVVTTKYDKLLEQTVSADLEALARRLARPYLLVDLKRASDIALWTERTWLLLDAREVASSNFARVLRSARDAHGRAIVLVDQPDPQKAEDVERTLDQAGVSWSLVTTELVVQRAPGVMRS